MIEKEFTWHFRHSLETKMSCSLLDDAFDDDAFAFKLVLNVLLLRLNCVL